MLNLQKLRLDFQSKIIPPDKYPGLDLKSIKESGRINSLAIDQAIENCNVGISLLEIDKIIHQAIIDRDCLPAFLNYKDYKHSSCLSVNSVAVHGVPNEYKLQDGDIIKIDVGTIYNGWYTDAARTCIVGNAKKPEHIDLVYFTDRILLSISYILRSGISLFDIAFKIQSFCERHNLKLIPCLGGHKIGFGALHMEPFISNVIPNDLDEQQKMRDFKLKAGDLICLEPVTCLNYPDGYVCGYDGWSYRLMDPSDVAAHCEATFLIEEKSSIIISS